MDALSKHGYPRHLILKDGDQVSLRPLGQEGDEAALLEFFQRVPQDDLWYLVDDVSNQELVRDWVRRLDPARVLPIVAQDQQGRIVASSSLHRYSHGARAHIGRIRLVVDPSFRNQRLGTYLLLDLIQLAMDLGMGLLLLELIRGVDDRAIRAARRLDFFEQAILPDYLKDRRGNNYDLVLMVKRLHRGYDDF